MKALVYTAPGRIELQDVPKPSPGPQEVLIRVHAVGICGSDMDGFRGLSRKRKPPLIMGHEFTGEIVESGNRVSTLKTGDQVVVQPLIPCGVCELCQTGRDNICEPRKLLGMDLPGAFAEYIVVPEKNCFHFPPDLSPTKAAMIEPLANAVHLFSIATRQVGGTAAIIGAGTVGLMALQVARLCGFSRVAITDTVPYRLEVARRLGAELALNAKDRDIVSQLREWAGDGGVDLGIDAVGLGVTRGQAASVAKPGAEAVFIGLHDGECHFDFRDVIVKELKLLGSYAYSNADFGRAIRFSQDPRLDLESWVGEMPLTAGPEIFVKLDTNPGDKIKVVLKP